MSDFPTPARPGQPIPVAVDFTPSARAALVTGARLAMCTGVPLKVLHVVHVPGDRSDFYPRRAEHDIALPAEDLAARMLQEFVDDTRRGNPELRTLEAPDTLLVTGLPATRIPEVARLVGASQVVMGQQRASELLGSLRTPLSGRIAERCQIPVTAVCADIVSTAAECPPRAPRGPVDADPALSS